MSGFDACLSIHPDDPEMECLSRKGHNGDHGVDVWPEGFQVGEPIEVTWPNGEGAA